MHPCTKMTEARICSIFWCLVAMRSIRLTGNPHRLLFPHRGISPSPRCDSNPAAGRHLNIVISRTSSTLGNSLSSFVTAYNAAIDALTAQSGPGGGGLTGDPIVNTLQQSLRTLVDFNGGSGTIQSLADVGVTVDKAAIFLHTDHAGQCLTGTPQDVASFVGSGDRRFSQNGYGHPERAGGSHQWNLHSEQTSLQTQVDRKNHRFRMSRAGLICCRPYHRRDE